MTITTADSQNVNTDYLSGGSGVRIEVTHHEAGDSLRGTEEIWVRAQSMEAMDWPRVEAKLPEDVRQLLKGRALDAYHPGPGGEDGFLFDDYWVFK